ncbi:MAG: DUF488 domain-containing protein [Clostridiales Family XIII bacterium]|jgi:uncharacterized protein (DUF488 family)|nr:DUF488 domain-containing protein [Clostridiales Family XIII bacterium]
MKELFTIGYSPFSMTDFLEVLKRYRIRLLIDVRSVPYSSHYSAYNKENLIPMLKSIGIVYDNYATEFGAQQTNPVYFDKRDGYLDFDKYVKSASFGRGFQKAENVIKQGHLFALMCAEKDPATCHRSIMVSRVFSECGYCIKHILADGKTEGQDDIETQLLDKYFPNRNQLTLWGEDQEATVPNAYRKRNEEIGFRLENVKNEAVHNWIYKEDRAALF